ncbi:MAG: magnesium chelatase, partial [Actinomycetota bacterium]|nr:magnesium chelatase [Actinomycetota bacterium]
PLKDRFGAQIRTHYPLDVGTELAVVHQEWRAPNLAGVRVEVPEHMAEIVATISHEARRHPNVNQRSGVSVRLSVANYETLVANALRRALRLGEADAVPRISDLLALTSSTAGKVEIETLDDSEGEAIIERLVRTAVLAVFRRRCRIDDHRELLAGFEQGGVVNVGDDVSSADYLDVVARFPALRAAAAPLAGSETPAAVASAVELVLEGLHLSRRLNKDAIGGRATYRSRV